MKKSFVMLGKPYEGQLVNGWYASEKLDGCRALWVPRTRGQKCTEVPFSNELNSHFWSTGLWSRDGKVIHAPGWWLDKLPNCSLDGELYLNKKSFQQTMSYTRKHIPVDTEWAYIKYMAFDVPVFMEAGPLDFKNKKTKILKSKIRLHDTLSSQPIFRFAYDGILSRMEQNDVLKVVKQTRIKDINVALEWLEEINLAGGEGVMLRNPDYPWTQCRTDNLLKLKPELEMIVTVCGYFHGEGKYYGMMGSLLVYFTNDQGTNKYFKVSGFTDAERYIPSIGEPFTKAQENDSLFPNGTKITISYRELSKDGIPKEARYKRT